MPVEFDPELTRRLAEELREVSTWKMVSFLLAAIVIVGTSFAVAATMTG